MVFGLIGLLTLALRHLQNTGRLEGTPFFAKQNSVIVEPPIVVDSKRSIVNITHSGQRYVLLLGPNNDILLESGQAIRIVESSNPELDRQHV